MSLAGCQINSIDVNFHLQKSLEIQLPKSDPKNTRGGKCTPSSQLGLSKFDLAVLKTAEFNLLHILCNILVRTLKYFQKKIEHFLCLWKYENWPQKLPIIGPKLFFQHCAELLMWPKIKGTFCYYIYFELCTLQQS